MILSAQDRLDDLSLLEAADEDTMLRLRDEVLGIVRG